MMKPVLVTGAAGRVGGVSPRVIEVLRASNIPVRAVVRKIDDRAEKLRALGAEIIIADLTKTVCASVIQEHPILLWLACDTC